jgi:hypothetical protein
MVACPSSDGLFSYCMLFSAGTAVGSIRCATDRKVVAGVDPARYTRFDLPQTINRYSDCDVTKARDQHARHIMYR